MTPRRRLPPGPAVVGIVNVTPDSFSDGGLLYGDPARAVDHALQLIEHGAAALDLGAESTRPGASAIPPAEQWSRLRPVLRGLRSACDAPLSVDTRHAEVAGLALSEGADAINDVSGLRHDPALAAVVAREGATLILMHSRGTPADMADAARYGDVVAEVMSELRSSMRAAAEAGVPDDAIVLDPGFGFAKTLEHNLEILRRLPELRELGCPLLVGLSRKAMVGRILGGQGAPRPVEDRVAGSVGLALAAVALGADYLRVHDVRETADALACFLAARPPRSPGDPSCPAG